MALRARELALARLDTRVLQRAMEAVILKAEKVHRGERHA